VHLLAVPDLHVDLLEAQPLQDVLDREEDPHVLAGHVEPVLWPAGLLLGGGCGCEGRGELRRRVRFCGDFRRVLRSDLDLVALREVEGEAGGVDADEGHEDPLEDGPELLQTCHFLQFLRHGCVLCCAVSCRLRCFQSTECWLRGAECDVILQVVDRDARERSVIGFEGV
jgi:hypothetical protein